MGVHNRAAFTLKGIGGITMNINLKNDNTMRTKQTKLGYSWTFFFFGWFVPLIRGDWKWFCITFIATIALAYFTFGLGSLIIQIVFAGFYNKLYIKDLLDSGFNAADEFSDKAIKGAGL